MSLFDREFEKLIDVEGGYTNNPDDSGGETMWGVTIAVARRNGYTGPHESDAQGDRQTYLQIRVLGHDVPG
jgi:lysozyme family protein